jgi:pyridinium-3,5-biscarboxylic acid mononucleotide synthase
MNPEQLRQLLAGVQTGQVSIDAALERLRALPYENLGFARLDTHRNLRQGFPEVIFCQGKTEQQVVTIAERLAAHAQTVLGTRASNDVCVVVQNAFPNAQIFPEARMFLVGQPASPLTTRPMVIMSAGTADIPVAEEAAITAWAMGNVVERLYDVGVAGLHRLLDNVALIQRARVIVVVAGMEGALASVVGGLVDVPVIAVPTSVGYGASFNGLAPLLTMLNSCATGVAVVNIDNGFGAGYLASMINRQVADPSCA